MLAATQPKVLMTIGSSCPATHVCMPSSLLSVYMPAIQLLSSSPPTSIIESPYFTTPAQQQVTYAQF